LTKSDQICAPLLFPARPQPGLASPPPPKISPKPPRTTKNSCLKSHSPDHAYSPDHPLPFPFVWPFPLNHLHSRRRLLSGSATSSKSSSQAQSKFGQKQSKLLIINVFPQPKPTQVKPPHPAQPTTPFPKSAIRNPQLSPPGPFLGISSLGVWVLATTPPQIPLALPPCRAYLGSCLNTACAAVYFGLRKQKLTNNLTLNLRCPATSGQLGNGAFASANALDQVSRS
ncbi:MAG: hypothetical protein JWQ04_223, partial [Pedosphaera sp.]|nr:hypothetical protein [Pedosphaera sp.]